MKTKSKILTWLCVLIVAFIVVAGVLVWLLMRPKQVVEVEKVVTVVDTVYLQQIEEVEKVVTVVDTVYMQQIEEIERNFNAAEFVVGKSDLSDDAKIVLHDLAKVMAKNPQLKLRLEGHTSAEGNTAFNQKLSDARAHAAVDFLVQHEGIDASRLEAIGYGSSKLKNTANPNAPENRRTEFIVIE